MSYSNNIGLYYVKLTATKKGRLQLSFAYQNPSGQINLGKKEILVDPGLPDSDYSSMSCNQAQMNVEMDIGNMTFICATSIRIVLFLPLHQET